jgi:hypothetical protein
VKRIGTRVAEALPVPRACRLLARRRATDIPIVLCIDVEPDERVFARDDARRWDGFERLLPRVRSLRERLSQLAQAPVAFTWLIRMDPQVAETWGSPSWAVETYGDVFDELQASGDELGLHTHLWRWDRERDGWVTDNDADWGERCVTMALDAYEASFGRPCPAHRGGDQALSGEALACLQARGVKVDFTVEPGLSPHGAAVPGEEALGMTPDYRGVPTRPYRSSPATFPAPDPASTADPLLVPLVTGPALEGGWGSTLVLGTRPSLFSMRLLAELFRGPPPVLAFALRTDPNYIRSWSNIVGNLEHLARHPGTRFVAASDAAARFA